MLVYKVEPIVRWPGTRRHGADQKHSPFRKRVQGVYNSYSESGTSWGKIVTELERELGQLWAADLVIRLDVTPGQLTVQGMLKSTSRPASSAVMLEFKAEKLPGSPRLVYKCDRFRDWQSNLYAIARSLEALRLVDRYEVTSAGEQYAGFKQLPGSTAPTMTTVAAAHTIAGFSHLSADAIHASPPAAKEAIRTAINSTHPDRNGGARESYDLVDTARKVLSSHHGVSL